MAVPAGAANGATITVRGRARDAAGNLSTELALTLTVGDTSPPTAAITQPAAGTVFTPGQSIGVQASGTDDVAIAQIVFRARGAITFDETRTFSPPLTPALRDVHRADDRRDTGGNGDADGSGERHGRQPER